MNTDTYMQLNFTSILYVVIQILTKYNVWGNC